MSSRSESDSESNRSGSPITQGPAPTPGHGLDRSASNSPQFTRSQGASPERVESRTSRSRSGSPASSARSRSASAESNKSAASQRSNASNHSRKSRSRSVASNHTQRSQSVGSNRSRSGSPASQKSGAASQRSGSNRSESPARSQRSRSSSAGSKKSRSRSASAASNKSRSRSGSAVSNKSRSRSGSPASNKSGSRSPSRSRSRSRSGSAASNRSKSAASHRSKSVESNRSRRSQSRSRSPSPAKGAGSRSPSPEKGAGSRSPSPEKGAGSQENSRSNSPNLQIDDPGSPVSGQGDKRKRDSSEERSIKKKSRVIASDSEGEEREDGKEVSAAAIFGDADDISSEEEKDKAESDKEVRRSDDEEPHRSEDENEERQPDDEEDKENEPEPIPETRIDVEIPKISCDLGRDIHFVKLPNFLSVDTRPFDPETYEDEIDEEETLDEEGRARLKLKVENTIRWKEVMDKEGSITKESNARLVRWSDGSYSLHLGSEIFDVYKQPLQGDHNHLFIRQGTGLQGQAVFRTKLSFRPHSTESFTHRKMTLSLADRSQKTSGIKILSQVGADPDADRKVLLKKEEEKLRQTVRASKPRTRKGDGGARSHNSSVYREEEGSEEEGAISLNAIKNKYKSGAGAAAKGGAIYSSDEEGSDIEARRARKLDKAKVLKDSESSEESE